MNIEQARFNMIEQQIRPWNVLDKDILDLLASMHRDQFAPLAYRNLAFSDIEIPLAGAGGDASQVMLAPRVEARMLQDLHVQAHERVLEIGAGSGFMAALLAARAKEVVTLDHSEAMVALARGNLDRAGVRNVDVRLADGAGDLADWGEFDAIAVSGSLQEVPQHLLDRLTIGGRLIAIVGDEPIMRARVVRRDAANTWSATEPWDAMAPRLPGFATVSSFHF
jgi:protein-L-isoaspartate(D-aspartate) O-methyltransferase